jgi:hypothetical protein
VLFLKVDKQFLSSIHPTSKNTKALPLLKKGWAAWWIVRRSQVPVIYRLVPIVPVTTMMTVMMMLVYHHHNLGLRCDWRHAAKKDEC